MCQKAGAQEGYDVRATSLPTLLRMVEQGLGITLLPESAAHTEIREGDRLSLVPFAEPVPQRQVGFAWRRSSGREDEYRMLADLFV